MIFDALLLLAGSYAASNLALTGQLVTAIGNTPSTNSIDIGPSPSAQNTDFGLGEDLKVVIRILQTLTSAGSPTVQFQLIQADDAALTSNVQVLAQTDAFAFGTLVAGADIQMDWPKATPYLPPKRYVGLRTVIGTAVLTNATGWLVAHVVKDAQDMGIGGRGPLFKSGYGIA